MAYSAEKLQIGRSVILLQRERTSVDPGLTCIQADIRTRREASPATKCPLVSRYHGRLQRLQNFRSTPRPEFFNRIGRTESFGPEELLVAALISASYWLL